MKVIFTMGVLRKNQKGFSLIEMSIVVIISGLMMAAIVQGYKAYQEKNRIYSTQAKIEKIGEAFERFFATYGFYPCPASYSSGPGDNKFGHATDCYNETSVADGTCGDEFGSSENDYCVSTTSYDHDSNALTPNITLRVRKGTIPFQTLKEGIGWELDDPTFLGSQPYGISPISRAKKYGKNFEIGAGDTVDAYGNRFTYVLTEKQATEEYQPDVGGIDIKDEHGLDVASHADYVIVSHGQDSRGGFGYFGDPQGACDATMPANEQENCDNDVNFIASIRYDTGANQYDDALVYRPWVSYYLWETSKNDQTNIHNLNTGDIGVGVNDPQEKLHVAGNFIVDDRLEEVDGSGSVIKSSGLVMANELCDYDATGGIDCFAAEKIGGEGMNCSDDVDVYGTPPSSGFRMAQGFRESKLHCDTVYSATQTKTCPAGQFLKGYTYDAVTKVLNITCSAP